MPKKTSKKVASKAKAASKKVEAPPAPAKVVEAPAAPVENAPPTLDDQFSSLLAQLVALRSQLTKVTTEVRVLQKRTDREMKAAQKNGRKRRANKGTRAPSGFVKPTQISNELASFLGKDKGTEMARTEVTREINAYIRKHNLQDPKNGRHILPDSKLRKLLKLKKDDELTYFNLQRYMSPHFAKGGKSPTANSM
uniref:DM2 domain-containing protein n=1 Tax=viral metagenome TaxID=1070528 RepID=A0A6C0CQD0_9ZZZZ